MKKIELWEANDGTRFETKSECTEYEDWNSPVEVYHVYSEPDLNEGKGFIRSLMIGFTKNVQYPELTLDFILYKMFGSPVAFVQGIELVRNYELRRVPINKFDGSGAKMLISEPVTPNMSKEYFFSLLQ